MESFEKTQGLRGFIIAPTAIIRGVGRSFGIDVVDVEGTTGYYDSRLDNKAEKVVELIR